jgi:4-hydroxy-3-polyprenylbenzoate decarboxylase
MTSKRIILAVTGASGAPYGVALLRELLKLDVEIHLIVSDAAVLVMREELGLDFGPGGFDASAWVGQVVPRERVIVHSERNLAAPPASGSFRHDGMAICPCSMKTLAAIAHGTGGSLIPRAADACLKERRRLVLVPRETPLSLIHLRNMVSATEAGAIVLPAMPGFYKRPQTIDDLVRHLVMKILDSLGLEHSINLRWKDRES